jgi:hypothetical protein
VHYHEAVATPVGRAEGRKRILTNVKLSLVCVGLVWMGAILRKPFLIAERMNADNVRLEKKAMDLKIEFQNKEKQFASLDAPGGMEREARKLGYVKKGEVLLIIPNR